MTETRGRGGARRETEEPREGVEEGSKGVGGKKNMGEMESDGRGTRIREEKQTREEGNGGDEKQGKRSERGESRHEGGKPKGGEWSAGASYPFQPTRHALSEAATFLLVPPSDCHPSLAADISFTPTEIIVIGYP